MPAKYDWMNKFRRNEPEAPQPRPGVIEDLRELRRQQEALESWFALESDDDLLDAAIYQREALEARERYLIRLARESSAVSSQLPVTAESRERWIN